MVEKEWFTVTEAAQYLSISRQTVYNLMDDGTLPYYVVKGVKGRRIKKEDLDALFQRMIGKSDSPIDEDEE